MPPRLNLRRAAPWMAIIAAPLVVFWRAVINQRLLAPFDGYLLNIPWYKLAAQSWRAGHLPAWNRFSFSGTSLLSMQQAAVFSPSMILYMFLPTSVAANFNIILAFMVAGVGAALLAREYVNNRIAWMTAGLTYAFSAFFFGHIAHPSIIITFSYLPWMCFGYLRLITNQNRRWLVVSIAIHFLALVSGHGQAMIMSELYFTGFVACDVIGRTKAERRRRILLTAIVLCATVGLGALQLIPTAIYTQSGRNHFSFSRAMSFSYPYTHALLYLFPRAFGVAKHIGPFHNYRGKWNTEELSGYMSMLAVVLTVVAARTYRRNRVVRTFLLLGAISLVLAFARLTPVSRVIYHIPILGQFRSWARYTVFCTLSVSILTAFGIQAIADARASIRTVTKTVLALLVLAILAQAVTDDYSVHEFLPVKTNHLLLFGPTFLFIGLAFGAIWLSRRNSKYLIVLPIVIFLDTFLSFGVTAEWISVSPPVAQLNADLAGKSDLRWGGVYDAPGGIDRYFLVSSAPQEAFGDSRYLRTDLMGLYSANGLDPLAPPLYRDRVGGMTAEGGVHYSDSVLANNSWIPDILRITTVVIDLHTVEGQFPHGPQVLSVTGNLKYQLARVTLQPRLPDVYGVGNVEYQSGATVVKRITTGDVDLTKTALVEYPCNNCPHGSASVAISKVARGQNTLSYQTDASAPAMTIASQSNAPGWNAKVDGKATKIYRVNGLVQGVVVPAGIHNVSFHYLPPGFKTGLGISIISLVGLVGGLLAWRPKRRNEVIDLRESELKIVATQSSLSLASK